MTSKKISLGIYFLWLKGFVFFTRFFCCLYQFSYMSNMFGCFCSSELLTISFVIWPEGTILCILCLTRRGWKVHFIYVSSLDYLISRNVVVFDFPKINKYCYQTWSIKNIEVKIGLHIKINHENHINSKICSALYLPTDYSTRQVKSI